VPLAQAPHATEPGATPPPSCRSCATGRGGFQIDPAALADEREPIDALVVPGVKPEAPHWQPPPGPQLLLVPPRP